MSNTISDLIEGRMDLQELEEKYHMIQASFDSPLSYELEVDHLRARNAEKDLLAQVENVITVDRYLKHFNKSSLTDFVIKYEKLEKENAKLKEAINARPQAVST